MTRLVNQDGADPRPTPEDAVKSEKSSTKESTRRDSGPPAPADKARGAEGQWEEALKVLPLIVPAGQVAVHPRNSDRVYVDTASYNSLVYFVLGEVNSPGRLAWTGRETVLDALQFAGGLDSSANPNDIRLVRPAYGKKPVKVYMIDLAVIREGGDAEVEFATLPGDRLIIGRKDGNKPN